MKTTKLILTFALALAFFCGCSSEEQNETLKENTLENATNLNLLDNIIFLENKNSESSARMFILPENPIFVQITYIPGLDNVQKGAKRSQYQVYAGIYGYVECASNNDREIWVVDNLYCDIPCGTGKLSVIDNDSEINRAIMQNNCND